MITKNGVELNSIEKWGDLAGPKKPMQWKDGRSAKEAAKTWHHLKSPSLPEEIESVLSQSDDFGDIIKWYGEPEVKISFDNFQGPSNMDLMIHATDSLGNFVIGVEAKADEPLGDYVKDVFKDALERKLNNASSKGILRIEQLTNALFGSREKHQPKVGNIRYQILTGIAATIKAAIDNNYSRAIFLIQEFHSKDETTDDKIKSNKIDIDKFINRFTNSKIKEVQEGNLYGPFTVPGEPLFDEIPKLYLAKVFH